MKYYNENLFQYLSALAGSKEVSLLKWATITLLGGFCEFVRMILSVTRALGTEWHVMQPEICHSNLPGTSVELLEYLYITLYKDTSLW